MGRPIALLRQIFLVYAFLISCIVYLQYMFGRYKVSKEDVLLLIDACDEMESQFFPYLAELVYGLQYCLTHVVVGHENTDGMEPVSCNAMLSKYTIASCLYMYSYIMKPLFHTRFHH